MIIDAWNYYYICQELKSDLLNSKLVKIKILDDYSYIFEILTFKGVKRLLIDLNYGSQCFFMSDKLTEIEKKEVSASSHDFMMILRKNIINCRLRDIYIYDWDRVIVIEFDDKRLVLEMFGKSSNIILISNNMYIIGCLKKYFPQNQNFVNISEDDFFNISRTINNGVKYIFPKNSRKSPGKLLEYEYIDKYKGFGKISGQVIKLLSESCQSEEKIFYADFSESSRTALFKNDVLYSMLPVQISEYKNYDIKVYSNYLELFNENYPSLKKYLSQDKDLIQKLNFLNREKKKLERKMEKLEDPGKISERYDKYMHSADLLKTVMYKYKIMDTDFIEVEDLFSENCEKLKIEVKKNRNISFSVENYYRLAQKEKKRLESEKSRKNEIADRLDEILFYIDNPEKFELTADKKVIEPEKIYGNVRKIVYKDIVYYIGKNADDNDYILSHIAKGNDLWFHAQNMKGAHVICKLAKNRAQPEFINKGAELAARNSEGKKGGNIPVDYTEVKFVRKIKGVKGKVTFSNNKTVFVKI